MTMISVIIPLYNKRDTIRGCIESVIRQTGGDFELIVINDGSTDGVETVLAEIVDPRLRIVHSSNGGVSKARNLGVEHARHDHVAFLDADDEWKPNYLARLQRLIAACPEASLFCGRFQIVSDTGAQRVGSYSLPPDQFGYVDNFVTSYLGSKSLVCSSSVCVRKEKLLSIGGFPEGHSTGEDVATWIALGLSGRVAADSAIVATVRVDGERINARVVNEIPYFIQKYAATTPDLPPEKAKDVVDFVSYYSLIYAAEAAGGGSRKMALTYARLWWPRRKTTAALCFWLSASPAFLLRGLKQLVHILAETRKKNLTL